MEIGAAFAVVLVQAGSPAAVRRPVRNVSDQVTDDTLDHEVHASAPPANIDPVEAQEKVKTAILDQLEKRGGQAVASERGLAALIGTSRGTARRAVQGLVLAGIVAAEATRNGTMLRLVA